jgi:NAD+--dinitrogen-reductase ADP-D-ribosyltransferase
MKPASLPAYARRSINRCNLPAIILGSLTFQQYPTPLFIDGVWELHGALFRSLESVSDPAQRAIQFMDYMRSSFLLDNLDDAGFAGASQRRQRGKANYLRLLRGWMFNADSIEGAVLKYWVESRFGLLPRSHNGRLGECGSERYDAYLAAYSQGVYNTNALETQVDLLYSYCQYELQRQAPGTTHRQLYRGINQMDAHDILQPDGENTRILLLNNLNSFSQDRHHADAFGDHVMAASIPMCKLLYFPGLLPGVLSGEGELLVIGGLYRVRV